VEPCDFTVLKQGKGKAKKISFSKGHRKLENLLSPGVSKEALGGKESEQKSILLASVLQWILQSKG
jgi:hypothetical protein